MKKLILVKENILNESPDRVTPPDGIMYLAKGSNSIAYSFEVIMNTDTETIEDVLVSNVPNMYHGEDDITHGPIGGQANITNISINRDDTYDFNWMKVYPGRIYLKPKVITFWVYPTVDEFKKIISIIEKKKKINIMNDGWQVEIYTKGLKNSGTLSYSNNYDRNDKSQFIPVEEFIGSSNTPKSFYIRHLDKKHNNEVVPGFGSKNSNYMKSRKWQMATPGMESLSSSFFPRLFENKY